MKKKPGLAHFILKKYLKLYDIWAMVVVDRSNTLKL